MLKVIVAGGAGFIGKEVVKKLLAKDYRVRVIDNLSKKRSKKDTVNNDKQYEFINADLTDYVLTEKSFRGFDICINLAAKIGGIGYFHKYPATILSENNKLYSSIFEAAAKNNFKRMVYISSSMVYETADKFPSSEIDVQKIPPPITSYGFSKLIGEYYCKSFWDEYKLPYSICRPFNAYGPNEYPDDEIGYAHVIPDLIKKIVQDQYPLELLGDGKQIRCFTHVSDLADGIVSVMESRKAVNSDFNIANSNPIDMFNLAKLIWVLMGKKKDFNVKYLKGFKHDIKIRIPDTKRIEKIIGWIPKIKLEDGLRETIDWISKTCYDKE